MRPRGLGSLRQSLRGQRILSTDVDEPLLRADGKRPDGHPLQNREWIPFHQNAVFESARLRLIRIANEVVRPARAPLQQKRFPFFPCGESSASTPQEARVDDFANNFFGTHVDREPKGFIAALSAIILDTAWIHLPDAAKQPYSRAACLRNGELRVQLVRFLW